MGKQTKKILIALIFLLSIISLVSSTNVQVNSVTTQGITIEYLKYDSLKANTSFDLNFHAFNSSDGKLLTNSTTNCSVHFYDPFGKHLLSVSKFPYDTSDNDYALTLNKNNFSQLGQHQFIIWCVNNEVGGFASGVVNVEYVGNAMSTSQAIIYSIIFILLIGLFIGSLFLTFNIPYYNPRDEDGFIASINNLKYLKIGLMIISYGIFVSILYIVSNVTTAYLGNQLVSKFFFTLYQIFLKVFIPYIITSILWMIYAFIRDAVTLKELKRGNYGE